jgi:hypothetical protein
MSSGTAQVGSSEITQPGASTGKTTGAKRGRKRAASSVPSYSYFTYSGNN